MKKLTISLLLSATLVAGISALTAQLADDNLSNDADLNADVAVTADLGRPSHVTGTYSNVPPRRLGLGLDAGPFQDLQDEEYGDLTDENMDVTADVDLGEEADLGETGEVATVDTGDAGMAADQEASAY